MDRNSKYRQAMSSVMDKGVGWSETAGAPSEVIVIEDPVSYTHTMHRRARGARILIPFILLELFRRWFSGS